VRFSPIFTGALAKLFTYASIHFQSQFLLCHVRDRTPFQIDCFGLHVFLSEVNMVEDRQPVFDWCGDMVEDRVSFLPVICWPFI
jgi:hypothetical protein